MDANFGLFKRVEFSKNMTQMISKIDIRSNVVKSVVTKKEAFTLISEYAPDVQVIEIVSAYCTDKKGIDCRQDRRTPSFLQLSTELFEREPLWRLNSVETIRQVLERNGIRPSSKTCYLLYDNIHNAWRKNHSSFNASALIYSVLKFFGVQHVAIIMEPAINAHFPDECRIRFPDFFPRSPLSELKDTNETLNQEKGLFQTPSKGPLQPSSTLWSDKEIAQSPLNKNQFLSFSRLTKILAGECGPYRLLDARTAQEHEGTITGYNYVSVAGHIPTSESIVSEDYLVTQEEELPSVLERLAEKLQSLGIEKNNQLIWYCGTGWRAARMCALTHALGYQNVAIYKEGWNEWHQKKPD